jgi:hypothetical protein
MGSQWRESIWTYMVYLLPISYDSENPIIKDKILVQNWAGKNL